MGMEGDDVNDKEHHHTRPILLAVVVNTTQVDMSWSAIEGGPSGYEVEWRPGILGPLACRRFQPTKVQVWLIVIKTVNGGAIMYLEGGSTA